jgi:hypothetical protein
VVTAVFAAIFAGIRLFVDITTPRVAILCEKPNAKLYFRDRFQGTVPVIFTESRAKSLVSEYDEIVRRWHRGLPSKEREIDLRGILSEHLTASVGFWLALEPGDEHRYHYQETPWGLALKTHGVASDSRGVHMDLRRRDAKSIEFVKSWQLPDKPVLAGATCQAELVLGTAVPADSIGQQWRVQIHYWSFDLVDYASNDPKRMRIPAPEAVQFERSETGTHIVSFAAPEEPGQYSVSLWIYAIPEDVRNNHPAADHEMITVTSVGRE